MNIWLGLFAHIDIVAKATIEDLIRLRGMGFSEIGKEYFVDEVTYRTLLKFLKIERKEVGGNAGNMAYFLGKLGIECDLSAPIRPKELMQMYENLPVFVWNHRRKLASRSARDDPNFAHIVLEIPPSIVEHGSRMIFTWDRMAEEGWIDSGFFSNMKNGIFVVSGFHLIKESERIKEITDMIMERKGDGIRIYLELGEPNKSTKTAFEMLLDAVDAIGMNEREAEVILGRNFVKKAKEIAKDGKVITVHTPHFVFSTEEEGLRKVIDVVETWACGKSYTEVTHMPLWGSKFVPTRKLPELLRTKGLGDAFAVLDALRLFYPEKIEEITEKLARNEIYQFYSFP